ncbi:hypothetical protein P3S67_019521 [Capsicum chacoense]|uniref:uncharacterized protein LOC107840063 n=1 Tax=Capsicum annuum TaxID=4072 RepID=UPI001FB186EB|nr:uncharacterized protein LOC107840063 [Capsicum annuum]
MQILSARLLALRDPGSRLLQPIYLCFKQVRYTFLGAQGLAVCNILHYGWHRPLYSEPIQHTHHIIATLQCTGSNHVTADICNPSRSHVLGGQHWTQAKKHTFLGAQGSWLLAPIPPAIQANQKTHLSWCPSVTGSNPHSQLCICT